MVIMQAIKKSTLLLICTLVCVVGLSAGGKIAGAAVLH